MSKLNPTPLITPPTFDDPTLKPTWYHHVWAAAGCTTVLFSLANAAVYSSTDSYTWLKTIFVGFIGYLSIDLVSGFYHWGFDNYGDFSTPIIGHHIDTFRRHHELPWATTRTQFSTNLYAPAVFIMHVVPPMNLMWHDKPTVMGFVGVAGGFVLFAEQIHVWAHESKRKLPAMVVAMQYARVFLPRSQHATHHRPPYDRCYCIVSGVWNRVLDEYKVFVRVEKVVFLVLGVQPRSWSEANSSGTAATATEAYFETSPP